jgi:3-methyladenine DNA glycosylase AlkD
MPTLTNKYHKALLKEIVRLAKEHTFVSKHAASYDGNTEKSYPLSSAQLRKIVKNRVKGDKTIRLEDYTALLRSIYSSSQSSTEKYLGGYLLEYMPKLRKEIDPWLVDAWLENLTGWAQVDSLCQSKFTAEDMLDKWDVWKSVLDALNLSSNVNKRRASLVLLTGPVRKSGDSRLANRALFNIERLQAEKDILITKAISWLLRDMIKLHRTRVTKYLEQNGYMLPRIAVRETRRKLTTGRK